MQRRLAAIMATDVVGYSRLMEVDEAGTLAALRTRREGIIDSSVARHAGRVVKLMGDGALIEFPSVVEAVQSALDIQAGLERQDAEVPEERRIRLRIGVNIGDVIVEDDDIYGDGVNIAARLQELAPPGGICVSDLVRQSAAGKLDVAFEDTGEQAVKNIARPVRVFRAVRGRAAPAAAPRAGRSRAVIALGLVACLTAGVVAAWATLGPARVESSATACTDHLGLPVPAEQCAADRGEE